MSDNPQLMKAKLSQSGIHCSLDWVTACLDWLTGEQPGLTSAQVLLKLQEQWLITDLTTPGVMDRPVLPPNLSECVKEDLPGQYTVQVQHGHDVSSPAYGQLQKLHQVDRENARVSADDSLASQAGQGGYQATQGGRFQQCWEPRPQRIMMLTVTDGFQTVEAMEHQVINVIPDVVTPGMKVQVLGPVTVRRGIIMLTSNSVRVLGGEVEELQEQFSLQTILQQKIGKEDVGQKGNMFSTQTGNPPPAPRPAPLPQAPAPATVPTPSMDSMSDDDDMMLLAASQLDMAEAVTSTQVSQPTATPHSSQPVARTHQQFSAPVRPPPSHPVRPPPSHPQHNRSAPVGVVQPLRTIAPSNLATHQPACRSAGTEANKMKSQSSITSFMVSKSSSSSLSTTTDQSSSTPSFSLLDSDDEFLSDLPLPPSLPPQSQTVPDEPFQYLINVKAAMQARPEAHILAKLKVVSSTLASKMSLRRAVSGPQWQVAIMLNDGSGSIKADLSPELLDREIGPANQYVGLGTSQQNIKAEYKERMKRFSVKLAEMSCLVTIKIEGEGSNPTIVKMEEISGLHTALMRKRRLV
eukprot:GFUD01017314.1.p1 GENE.GFUD01017314.1~~GFUD01017314.1.p1  ORF type:complete len:578 (-),score=233.17 GFUD01017314.1:12-1745(-)